MILQNFFFPHWEPVPAGDYMFKVNNRSTGTRCETCLKLIRENQKDVEQVFVCWVTWEHIYLKHSYISWSYYIWAKVFNNGPAKICGRQPLKNLKWYGLPKTIISWNFLKWFLEIVYNYASWLWLFKLFS